MESKVKKVKEAKKTWNKPLIKAELSIEKTLGSNPMTASDMGGAKGS